ncbi:efflux RND transporter periplasmic adaptor subunit [Novosphingobium resinovorum]|uniref:efflux RND transporter periplasmic adaptor subunit n=1 Tax=Novosphingobium resinovorum TaxID=158500 RepID=UPI002ED0756B|nr:efflux RND transporter periplasmic adaptor subunit [Novosphingobium resinovorum]
MAAFAHGDKMVRLGYIISVAAILLSACQQEAPVKDERRPVAVMTVAEARGGASMRYAGEIRSAFESQIGFQVAGRIVERTINLGDTVHAGQTLLRIDGADYARAQASAAAQAGAARTSAAAQRADLARSRELLAKGFISPAEFDQQKASTAQADAQLRAAAAQSGTASAQLARTVLSAPRAGVVTQIQGEVGQVVGAGQTIVTMADTTQPEIAVSLPEGGLAAVRDAARFSVTVWGDPGKSYPARLRTLSGAADPATRTFAARFSIDAPAGALLMGETAELQLHGKSMGRAVQVPLTAVVETNGKARVWVLDRRAMTVRPRDVRIGAPQGETLTVTSGLKPGEGVVTAGVHLLHSGEKVRIAKVPTS